MKTNDVKNYRDYLNRYAEVTKQRRPNFSLGAWAKSLGLKSTSSLTKVLNGERDAGPELLKKFVQYFNFNPIEEAQFRNLVALSKMKESAEVKTSLAALLSRTQNSKDLKSRMLELDQFELLRSYLPLAVRELVRLPKMKISKLVGMMPKVEEEKIKNALHILSRLNLIHRDESGHFIASDAHVHTEHEIPNEAIQTYHEDALQLAKEKLNQTLPAEREFQSLVLLAHSNQLPELKQKIMDFLDSIEGDLDSQEVNQLYQLQVQLIPISKRFEEQPNPNLNQEKNK